MQVSHLRTAIAVMEAGSYSGASPKVNLTPAGVLFQVRKVEKELGYKLFKRHSGGIVRPTEQGREYLFYARLALDLLARGGRVAVEVGKGGRS